MCVGVCDGTVFMGHRGDGEWSEGKGLGTRYGVESDVSLMSK